MSVRAASSRLASTSAAATAKPRAAPPRRSIRPRPSAWPAASRDHSPSIQAAHAHLDTLFQPLGVTLGRDIAERAITTKGWALVRDPTTAERRTTDHNRLLTFIGRRALRLHLSLALHQTLATRPDKQHRYISQARLDEWLDTHHLGVYVASAWGLQRTDVVRWVEMTSKDGKPTGSTKAYGSAVEALIGAVHLEHGIEASQRVFTSMVAPFLQLPRGAREANYEYEAVAEASPPPKSQAAEPATTP